MAQRVMGMETEYAISGQNAECDCLEKPYLAKQLIQLAAERLVNLPAGENGGLFLANGSRFYIDSGSHPELSTPECLTPWEVARYVSAGDLILRDLAEDLSRRLGMRTKVEISKINVDYSGSGNTWGCHESYAHQSRNPDLFGELTPHLVSRIIYTGAGGFNSLSPGLEFSISPRVHHLTEAISSSSTNDRGIVHTKNEDLTGGTYRRLHLLCGESLFSQTAAVLKTGTTALIVALLERGMGDLGRWCLGNPVGDMNVIARDPTCSVAVKRVDDSMVSALEIQKHYLSLVENELGAEWLPPWAEDLCGLWRRTLDRLAEAPHSVCGTLDWAIKNLFFERLIQERDFNPEEIDLWNEFQNRLCHHLTDGNALLRPQILNILLDSEPGDPQLAALIDQQLAEQDLDRGGLHRFLELRRDLFLLDARFNTVGKDCVFASLQDAGVLDHEVPEFGDPVHAMTEAPEGTRAHLRGKAIKALADQKGENLCSWDFVFNQAKGVQLDLQDPFNLHENWEPVSPRHRYRTRFLRPLRRRNDFLDLVYELGL